MLYNTHKRYGQVAGLVSLPLANEIGLLNTSVFGNGLMADTLGLIGLCAVGLYGATFGAEFPDLDSPTSKPAQKHKILSGVFRACGVKHRGKFSHDILVQTGFWAMIFFLITWLNANVVFAGSEIGFVLAQVFVGFTYVGVLSHLLGDALTVDGVWFAGFIKVRLMPIFVRKIGFGNWKPFKTFFTTGSAWNDINYKVMTFMLPIAFLFTVVKLFTDFTI